MVASSLSIFLWVHQAEMPPELVDLRMMIDGLGISFGAWLLLQISALSSSAALLHEFAFGAH